MTPHTHIDTTVLDPSAFPTFCLEREVERLEAQNAQDEREIEQLLSRVEQRRGHIRDRNTAIAATRVALAALGTAS